MYLIGWLGSKTIHPAFNSMLMKSEGDYGHIKPVLSVTILYASLASFPCPLQSTVRIPPLEDPPP